MYYNFQVIFLGGLHIGPRPSFACAWRLDIKLSGASSFLLLCSQVAARGAPGPREGADTAQGALRGGDAALPGGAGACPGGDGGEAPGHDRGGTAGEGRGEATSGEGIESIFLRGRCLQESIEFSHKCIITTICKYRVEQFLYLGSWPFAEVRIYGD